MKVTIEINDLPYEAKVALTKDERTSPELLAALATDKDRRIRILVAWHSSTSSEVLDALANDCDSVVRKAVAENPNTPYKTLVMLSHDMEFWVEKNAKKLLREHKKKEKNNIER